MFLYVCVVYGAKVHIFFDICKFLHEKEWTKWQKVDNLARKMDILAGI